MSGDPLTLAWLLIAVVAAIGTARHWRRWQRQRTFARWVWTHPHTAEERAEADGWARDEGFRCGLKGALLLGAVSFTLARMTIDQDAAPIILRSMGVVGFGIVVGVLTHWTRAVDQARRQRHARPRKADG